MEYQYEDDAIRGLERELMRQGYSRRDVIKLAGALGLTGLLSACGLSTGQNTATKSPYSISDGSSLQWPRTIVAEPTSPIQLSVAHSWDAIFWTRQVQFDTLFMKRHPNIIIKAENTPFSNYIQKYIAQAAGGTLPDIIYCQYAWAQQLIQPEVIEPLDDYISRQPDFNLGDFTKPSLDFYRRDGKLYGIVYDCGPRMLFYNKQLFDQAGVKYPTNDWTLEDLKQAATKLASGKGRTKIFGLLSLPTSGDASMAPGYLFPFGARYVNEPQETKSYIDQPEAVSAMEWWWELMFKYNAVPTPAEQLTLLQDAFTSGRSAMMMAGSWSTPGLTQNAHFKWDMALWPQGPKGRIIDTAGSAYMIPKSTENKNVAWIYLNEYLSPAGQSFMWGMTGRGSPARKSAWPSYFASKFAPRGARLVYEALNNYATNQIMYQPRVTDTAGPVWDRVVAGDITIADGLHQITQQIDPILALNAS